MPETPLSAAEPPASIEEALDRLREHNGRATTARRAILALLFDAEGPLTAQQVATASTPVQDLASTYRNLEHLEGLGIVRHVHLGHGPAMYERARSGEHEYSFCEACQVTRTFAPEQLDSARAEVERVTGIRPRFTHFPLVGICAACRTRAAAAPQK